ncbi:hypothetical protein BDV97DRAFT_399185 [Delphinella strobiligena]|nr:hypothetical protein BDV97DRAFT_399185 [Delphinella strobiligena]
MSRTNLPQSLGPLSRSSRHIQYRFEPNPNAINCTTFPSTRTILADHAHPLYKPFKRRISAWDPTKLVWASRCPSSLSRKRTVRMWVMKRIREAFLAELKHNGFDRTGTRASLSDPSAQPKAPRQLSGALCIVAKQSVLTAPFDEIRHGCSRLLHMLIKAQHQQMSQSAKRRA